LSINISPILWPSNTCHAHKEVQNSKYGSWRRPLHSPDPHTFPTFSSLRRRRIGGGINCLSRDRCPAWTAIFSGQFERSSEGQHGGNEFYFRGGIYCNLHESELKIASREVLQYRETSLFNQDGTDDLAVIGRECLIKKVKTRWSKVRIK
jgi:hypothetical protein